MPVTPPLSPVPQRWRPSSLEDDPHLDFASLLQSFDTQPSPTHIPLPISTTTTPTSSRSGNDGERLRGFLYSPSEESDEREVEYLTAPGTPARRVPEIRTTSPSPQRPIMGFSPGRPSSPSASSNSSDTRSSSPLPGPPSRGQMFNETTNTGARLGLTRTIGNRGSLTGPRGQPSRESTPVSDTPHS